MSSYRVTTHVLQLTTFCIAINYSFGTKSQTSFWTNRGLCLFFPIGDPILSKSNSNIIFVIFPIFGTQKPFNGFPHISEPREKEELWDYLLVVKFQHFNSTPMKAQYDSSATWRNSSFWIKSALQLFIWNMWRKLSILWLILVWFNGFFFI